MTYVIFKSVNAKACRLMLLFSVFSSQEALHSVALYISVYMVDECATNPCCHGKCYDNYNTFLCICEEGWIGKTCCLGL